MFPFFIHHHVFLFLLIILCLTFFSKGTHRLPSFTIKIPGSDSSYKIYVLPMLRHLLFSPLLTGNCHFSHSFRGKTLLINTSDLHFAKSYIVLCSHFTWLARSILKVNILLYILPFLGFHNSHGSSRLNAAQSVYCLFLWMSSKLWWPQFLTLLLFLLSIHCILGLNQCHGFRST